MDWNTFIQYSKIFLSGLVVSLPSIIAAMGIIINNRRATVRMKDDRKNHLNLVSLKKYINNMMNVLVSILILFLQLVLK